MELLAEGEQNKIRHSPLRDSKTHIRLITLEPSSATDSPLHCTIKSVKHSKHFHRYNALSYTWDATSGLNYHRDITINGRIMEIRENLWKALGAIRHRILPIKLWVDAICIDQEEIEERNSQVSIMSNIYAYAKTVLVWLGDADGSSNALFDSLRKCNDKCSEYSPHSREYFTTEGWSYEDQPPRGTELLDLIMKGWPYEDQSPRGRELTDLITEGRFHEDQSPRRSELLDLITEGWSHEDQSPRRRESSDLITEGWSHEDQSPLRRELSDLIALSSRPYWSRAWIRQEIFFSREVVVFCGSKVVPWQHLRWLCFQMSEADKHNRQVDVLMRLMGVTSKFNFFWAKTKMPMLEVIQSLHDGQCLIPHDRVFSLLSMASDEPLQCGLKVDYQMPFEELVVKTVAFSCPRKEMGLIELLADVSRNRPSGVGAITSDISALYACAEFMWNLFEKGRAWPEVMCLPYKDMRDHFLGKHEEWRGTCHVCCSYRSDEGLA